MANDDNVIENDVVRIYPDLSGFRRGLERELKIQLAGVKGEIPVQLNTNVNREALNYVAALRAKYIKDQLKQVRNGGEQVQKAHGQALDNELNLVRSKVEQIGKTELQAYAANSARSLKQVRSGQESLTRAHVAAIAEDASRSLAAERELTRGLEREYSRQAADDKTRRSKLSQEFKRPQLIALGQEGVRPINLLYAAAVAAIPVITAMASSAIQASTSLAALGAAGYAAGLGVTALVVGFKGLSDVLALRKTVQAEQTQAAANATKTNDTLTNALDAQQNARDALSDAQANELKTQQAINTARQQAIRDLVDLRQKVADLQNQEKSDKLSVSEAKVAQKEVERNYFATPLQRQRAAQDTADAVTREKDTRLSLAENTTDLKKSVKAGVNGSTVVKDAVSAHNDAVRTVKRDTTALAKAGRTVGVAKSGGTVSTAKAQLDEQLGEHSQAFRDLYGVIDKDSGVLKTFRNRIEQATLPGFTTFLKDIFDNSKDSGSTVAILADGIADVGGAISDTVKRLGEITKSKFFKNDLKTLNKTSKKGTQNLGDAAVTLVKPLLTITTAAAPLFVKFTGYIDKLAHKFADFIDDAAKNGSLKKWFEDAGTEAGKWRDIVVNLATVLVNLFKLSLPSGNSLVQRFADFTKQLADWTGSDSGKKDIKGFFDFFKNLNYGQIAQIVASAVEFFAAYKAVAFLSGGKILSLVLANFASFVSSHPEVALQAFTAATKVLNILTEGLAKHPQAAATLLAILTAARIAKAVNIGIKLPGVDNLKTYLTNKFKPLEKLFGGETAVATMTVKAGVVNITGASITSGAAGNSSGASVTPSGKKDAAGNYLDTHGNVIDPSKPVSVDPKTGKPVYIDENGKVKVGGKPSSKLVSRFSKSPAAKLGAAAAVSLAASAAINQIPTTAGTTADALKAAAEGALSGAATGAAIAGPLGAFVGAGVGAIIAGGAVGGYIYNGDTGYQNKFTDPNQKDEAKKFVDLNKGLSNNSSLFAGNNTTAADNYKPLQDYITARQKSVTALVDQTKKTKGLSDAQKVATTETDKSKTALENLLTQTGFTKDGAKKYADQVYGTRDATKALTDKTDSLGYQFDDTRDKIDYVNVRTGKLHDTLKTITEGDYTIAISTQGYAGVKKQLDLLYATQHVLYNPAYSNSAAGADTVSSQNQYLDPKTGLPVAIASLKKATGGPIRGKGTATSDSIPAWLSHGEYVMPAKTVQRYGMGTMEAMRQNRLAAGGPVGKIPMVVNLPTKGFQFPTAAKTGNASAPASYGTVIGDIAVEQIAYATARAMGATAKQMLALFEAGVVESGFQNLAGGDRDSVGFLQQRPSQGWGTVAQIRNPAYATRKFLERAARVKNQDKLTAGQLAQSVQRSGFPLRYDQHQGDAQAILASFLTPSAALNAGAASGVLRPLFGRWPTSPAVDHGHDSGIWRKIIQYVAPTGLDRHSYGTLYQNRRTDNGNWSWHSDGRAVDFGGNNQDKLAQFFMARRPSVLELIHRTDTADYGIKRGQVHDMGHEFGLHKNHVHVAMANGGLAQRTYDSGGGLPPGYTLAYNGTGRTETVRTARQEANLQPATTAVRLDRRDIVAIAHHLGAVFNGQQISMDGRAVAEVTNKYNYLPAGV